MFELVNPLKFELANSFILEVDRSSIEEIGLLEMGIKFEGVFAGSFRGMRGKLNDSAFFL